jgi:epoxyqueuosine reductase
MSDPSLFFLRQAIEKESRRLGFELFGVTTPEPPQRYKVFENWLAAGRHAEMASLASERSRQQRANPRLLLPECQSILVLGIRYAAPGSLDAKVRPPESGLVGRTAAFAWGEDYHDVIPERLGRLAAFIENMANRPVEHRIYTDSGPLLERELAQRAGLGWKGRNSILINRQHGSFFLLGEILLDLKLEPDRPFTEDYCGSCRRCLEACPTGCIQADRTIDAGRCIAYLTIEHRGSIPPEIRRNFGMRIFGCDICQQVCPWNQRTKKEPGDAAFVTRLASALPDLLAEMSLSTVDFNRKTKGSSLRRAKKRGYLRNVSVALGCTRDVRAVPVLEQALSDLEPLIRIHSAWALGQIGGEAAVKALGEALLTEADPSVMEEINIAIQHCWTDDGVENRTETR